MTFRPGSRALAGARPRRRCSPPAARRSATIRAISSTSRWSPRSSPASTIAIRSPARSAGRPSSASSTSATGIMSRATPASSPSTCRGRARRPCSTSASTRPAMSRAVAAHRRSSWSPTSSRPATRRRRWAATAACFEELFGNIGAVGQRGQSAPDRGQSRARAVRAAALERTDLADDPPGARARPGSPGPTRSRSSRAICTCCFMPTSIGPITASPPSSRSSLAEMLAVCRPGMTSTLAGPGQAA